MCSRSRSSESTEFLAVRPERLESTLVWSDCWPIFEACYDLRKLLPFAKEETSKALISRWVAAELAEVQGQVEVTTNAKTNFLDSPRLYTSPDVQVGVCVEAKRERGEDPQEMVPLVCMEVQSYYRVYSDMTPLDVLDGMKRAHANTLAKLAGMLIHQLCAFRNFDISIMEVCGFMFPRLGVDSALTKITVSWKNEMQFRVKFQAFQDVGEARDELKSFFSGSVFLSLLQRLSELDFAAMPAHRTIIPLSSEEIERFGASKQIPSNSSIILYCPGNTAEGTKGRYLKYNPSYQDNSTPWEFREPNDVVVSMTKPRELAPFYESQEHKRIHFEEAKAIKHKFVKATADSLEKLHEESDRAHLDVRLPNICYDEDGVVRFIDFDRSAPARNHAYMFQRYTSNMYKAPSDGWTMAQLDWKQFGLLIGQLTQENYDVENPPVCSGPIQGLLDALLKEGRWDEGAYQAWVVSESHGPGPHT